MFMCSNKYSYFLNKKKKLTQHYWKVQTGLLHLALIELTVLAKTLYDQSNSLSPLQLKKKKKNHYHPMFVTILLLFIYSQIDN